MQMHLTLYIYIGPHKGPHLHLIEGTHCCLPVFVRFFFFLLCLRPGDSAATAEDDAGIDEQTFCI